MPQIFPEVNKQALLQLKKQTPCSVLTRNWQGEVTESTSRMDFANSAMESKNIDCVRLPVAGHVTLIEP